VAETRTYRCRFSPDFSRMTYMRGLGYEMAEYLVPVEWWSYADDRLDARCPAELSKANVAVKAYSPVEARDLVVREWNGTASKIGVAVVKEAA